MKNKQGFTLVELLAVIVILALLATMITPAFLTIQKKIKGKMFDAKDKMIREAAVLYAEKNHVSNNTKISVLDLCTNKFLDVDKDCAEKCSCQLNPVKNASMDGCEITITKNAGNRYKAEISSSDDECKGV